MSPESAFAKHILESDYNLENINIATLHISAKGRVMNNLEEMEIYKHKNSTDNVT